MADKVKIPERVRFLAERIAEEADGHMPLNKLPAYAEKVYDILRVALCQNAADLKETGDFIQNTVYNPDACEFEPKLNKYRFEVKLVGEIIASNRREAEDILNGGTWDCDVEVCVDSTELKDVELIGEITGN